MGKPTEHYHPTLVKKIEKHFTNRKKPLPGWKTPNRLIIEEKLKVGLPTVVAFAEKFRDKNPEWFEFFWYKGRSSEEIKRISLDSGVNLFK